MASATHAATISLEYQVSLPFLTHEITNLNYRLGVAVACAIKTALEQHNLSGKIMLLGTPGNEFSFSRRLKFINLTILIAEEVGAGKIALLEKGAYEGMDACLMCVDLTFPRRSDSNRSHEGAILLLVLSDRSA